MGLNDESSCFIDFSAALSRSAQKVELVNSLNAAYFREKESICVRSNCFDQTRQELVSDYLNRVRKVGRNKQKNFLLDLIFQYLCMLRKILTGGEFNQLSG